MATEAAEGQAEDCCEAELYRIILDPLEPLQLELGPLTDSKHNTRIIIATEVIPVVSIDGH